MFFMIAFNFFIMRVTFIMLNVFLIAMKDEY